MNENQITDLNQLDPKDFIIIKGARVNNLKNISAAIPRNKLTVITGLSGSGKSSLAFDTLFAEGQRMYLESLSAYSRQFLGKLAKPDVDAILGLSPAIAIEQKSSSNNPNSTVGTITEIYDYLKLLYARIGTTYSPVSGKKVTKDTVSDIVDYIVKQPSGSKVMIFYPMHVHDSKTNSDDLKTELSKGYTRMMQDGKMHMIEEVLDPVSKIKLTHAPITILVDRLVLEELAESDDIKNRITDSVETAFFEGKGICSVEIVDKGSQTFSNKFEQDGIPFEVPSVNFFSFNNSYGVCKLCQGKGKVQALNPELVIPNPSLSVRDGAILPFQPQSMQRFINPLFKDSAYQAFPVDTKYKDLTEEEKDFLWNNDDNKGKFKGIKVAFDLIKSNGYRSPWFVAQYESETCCPDCLGTNIRKDASYVKVGDYSIHQLLLMPLEEVYAFFDQLTLSPYEQQVANRLVLEIKSRITYLEKVGLSYLTLNRSSTTLSGGEFQRIKLATALGGTLVDTLYILDEPTVGLHPKDTDRLIEVLLALRDLGNTVVVVEHEEALMRVADHLIDIGPEAGSKGGELVFQGDWEALRQFNNSHTAQYLNGVTRIEVPKERRKAKYQIHFCGIEENNLKNIDVTLPLHTFTVVTGVSGSGKSTLVNNIIYAGIANKIDKLALRTIPLGKFRKIDGDFEMLNAIEVVDQNSVVRSSRSNPATYIHAYDDIRTLFAKQPLAKERQYPANCFSFNSEGGRCPTCEGVGEVVIEMQFMADVTLVCEDCNGKRFKQEILEVLYKETSILDILHMTVDDACEFFNEPSTANIYKDIKKLQEVGLGYIQLGQSCSSLSGGEAQRLRLANYFDAWYRRVDINQLSNPNDLKHKLFIFDEPTTGLHIHDIHKLLRVINHLVEIGNSVIVVEHNMEFIKCADWIIDMGPEGGKKGGKVVFAGTPEDMIKLENNHTATYLKQVMAK